METFISIKTSDRADNCVKIDSLRTQCLHVKKKSEMKECLTFYISICSFM